MMHIMTYHRKTPTIPPATPCCCPPSNVMLPCLVFAGTGGCRVVVAFKPSIRYGHFVFLLVCFPFFITEKEGLVGV